MRRKSPTDAVVVVMASASHAEFGSVRVGDLLRADHPLAGVADCRPWSPPSIDDDPNWTPPRLEPLEP